MRREPKYYDGLDDDGYAQEPWRQPYVRGSEADVGDFKPVNVGGIFAKVVDRAAASVLASGSADSPIETILGAAVLLYFRGAGKPLMLCLSTELEKARGGLLFVPQFKWSIYRSDWALYNPKTSGAMLLECDGKEFHSSSDQRAHDRKKDAAAHDRGFLTMRFTGSQIHRDADGCAQKVYDVVYGGAK